MSLARRLAADLVGRGSLPRPVAALIGRASGFRQVLLTRAAIDAALGHGDIHVPYGERSALLGLGGFPLALDGPDHGRARAHIGAAIAATAAAHRAGVTRAAEVATAAVRTAGPRLDLVEDVVDPALRAWVETWFGLPGFGPDLHLAGQLAMHTVFLNPALPNGETDAGALPVAQREIQRIGSRYDAAMAAHGGRRPVTPAEETLGPRLWRDPPPGSTARGALVGLTVGPLALGSMALSGVVDALVGTGQLEAATTPALGEELFSDTLGGHHPLPGLPRTCPHDVTVTDAEGMVHELPAGPLLALTSTAAWLDPGADPAGLAFGVGPHRCMGPTQVTQVAGVVLAALAEARPRRIPGLRGTRRDAPAPSGVARWPFPGSLLVELS